MESVYLKNLEGTGDWFSDKIHFKPYFDKYSKTLNKLIKSSDKKTSEIDILQRLVPQSNQLSSSELTKLVEVTNGERLTKLSETDVEKKPNKDQLPSTSSSAEVVEDSEFLKKILKKKKNRVESDTTTANRAEIILKPPPDRMGRRNLVPRKHFIVSFRVHKPFQHKTSMRTRNRTGRCLQEIWLLGHQRLVDLKEKIRCETDHQDAHGDVSNNPDVTEFREVKALHPSSMFYFDNTFYIDKRIPNNVDYSIPIKEWWATRGLHFGDTKLMEDTPIENLQVRLGYPYLYMHQGFCEHVIIVNDARLLTEKDSLHSIDYPLVSRVTKHNFTYCMTCSNNPAKWIIRDSDRLAHDPTFQCELCFKRFHYIDGKKICKFRAYQYIQRSIIF